MRNLLLKKKKRTGTIFLKNANLIKDQQTLQIFQIKGYQTEMTTKCDK